VHVHPRSASSRSRAKADDNDDEGGGEFAEGNEFENQEETAEPDPEDAASWTDGDGWSGPEATGNVRLGVSNENASMDGPVGSCRHSYGLRDVNGARVHCGIRRGYMGRGLRPGDVVGVLLVLPEHGLVPEAADASIDRDMSVAGTRSRELHEVHHEQAEVPMEGWMYAFSPFGVAVGASAQPPAFPLQCTGWEFPEKDLENDKEGGGADEEGASVQEESVVGGMDLPPLPLHMLPRVERKNHPQPPDNDEPAPPKSYLRLFLNGRDAGVAFADLRPALRYFPSVSCSFGGSATLRPGPAFEFPPSRAFGEYRPLSDAFAAEQAAQRQAHKLMSAPGTVHVGE
jgi:hypothetical protein